MRLVVLHSDYGSERYFNFYLMENGKCLDAKWSKRFTTKDTISEITVSNDTARVGLATNLSSSGVFSTQEESA